MKHLFQSWPEFSRNIRAATRVLLLSDYDGTLTPIVGNPHDAVLKPDVRNTLKAISDNPAFSVGIISGRLLSDLKSLAGIESIYYAGNHGLEIEGPGISYINETAGETRAEMQKLAGELDSRLRGINGVIIENKGLSLSVHYRLVSEFERQNVINAFEEITALVLTAGRIRVSSGKMIKEVRPPVDWHKGKAVETIKQEIRTVSGSRESAVIYMGDDTTDEDAFGVVNPPEGWSIFIGPGNPASSADYFLDSPDEVAVFLSRLLELK